jgi:hypothetical protein
MRCFTSKPYSTDLANDKFQHVVVFSIASVTHPINCFSERQISQKSPQFFFKVFFTMDALSGTQDFS